MLMIRAIWHNENFAYQLLEIPLDLLQSDSRMPRFLRLESGRERSWPRIFSMEKKRSFAYTSTARTANARFTG